MNWIMYTVGIVAHLWGVMQILGLLILMDSFEVKYLKQRVNIHIRFFVPYVGVIAFWMWFFFG